MTYSDPALNAVLEDLLDPASVEVIFRGASGGLNVRRGTVADAVQALNQHPHLRAFAREDVPPELYFKDNARILKIVVIPDLGWHLSTKAWLEKRTRLSHGDHGYDPASPYMSALLVAHGTRIKSGTIRPAR
ncbi:MAG: alkaline phosphatase family protein [Candidatus Synoicihabitans palmerolidicus]|nr:alkaline phosphatase family protein [Candidatus Synoicihabitans palmerolidicus]